MKILGIDPGSRKAGFSLIEVHPKKKITYLTSGILKYDHIELFLERLGVIYSSCEELVERFSPDEISIESLIYVKSVESLSKLAQARGAMVAAFSKTMRGKIFEYFPNLVKSSVAGHGHADKESIDKAMTLIFGRLNFQSSDESDSLAIAVCHALNRATLRLNDQKNQTRELKL